MTISIPFSNRIVKSVDICTLTQNTCHVIMRDNCNYIWFATQNAGVAKHRIYDGHHLVRLTRANPHSERTAYVDS